MGDCVATGLPPRIGVTALNVAFVDAAGLRLASSKVQTVAMTVDSDATAFFALDRTGLTWARKNRQVAHMGLGAQAGASTTLGTTKDDATGLAVGPLGAYVATAGGDVVFFPFHP
jgi:hypothetical protein